MLSEMVMDILSMLLEKLSLKDEVEELCFQFEDLRIEDVIEVEIEPNDDDMEIDC